MQLYRRLKSIQKDAYCTLGAGAFGGIIAAGIEPIRNLFVALFLVSIGMLVHVHFLWNLIDYGHHSCQEIWLKQQDLCSWWNVSGTDRGICTCSP
ncbi:hypothetical protein Patl1_33252 [Pistacia atlantica]|uniref:Uncharacterized protein n=1 Tax=Pistacia atlantica TaxID=434234 RepID=A0ACC1AQ09_9ROSI|nr:hypothetical protein Patl1_33252 [Pistacia atlantica]